MPAVKVHQDGECAGCHGPRGVVCRSCRLLVVTDDDMCSGYKAQLLAVKVHDPGRVRIGVNHREHGREHHCVWASVQYAMARGCCVQQLPGGDVCSRCLLVVAEKDMHAVAPQ